MTDLFWQEDEVAGDTDRSDPVVDVRFAIDCRRIPVDHAHALAVALRQALPWIADEPMFAPHSIHVAGSQNGWERPEHGTESFLLVSRRTRLAIRVPGPRAAMLLAQLPGARLDLGGQPLLVGPGAVRKLSRETTVFARYLAFGGASAMDEDAFLRAAAQALSELGIRIRKALCGRTVPLFTPEGSIVTRSLMLAGLTPEESVRLQQQGLGAHRLLGCGIFIPHKGVASVKSD